MRYLSIFIAVGLFAVSASAQITITEGSLAGIGTELSDHFIYDEMLLELGSPAPDQTWDYSAVEFDGESSVSLIDPNDTPWAGEFPNLDVIARIEYSSEIQYRYFDRSPQAVRSIGFVSAYDDDTLVSPFILPATALPLPLTFGSAAWHQAERYTQVFGPFTDTFVDSSRKRVDAWGTLLTPFGEYQVLRVHSHEWRIWVSSGIPMDTLQNDRYEWIDGYGNTLMTAYTPTEDTLFNVGWLSINEIVELNRIGVLPEIPNILTLHPNYPNPFNPTTTIAFDLAERGFVTLNVFNVAGQLVATPVEGIMPAGSHHVMFDASTLASGVFFARLNARGESLTRKMILMR